MKNYSIAIDGPAGAGKSTFAKALARELRFTYVDTGAIYRSVGYYAIKNGISADDKKAIIDSLPNIDIGIKFDDESTQHMILNGDDVSKEIRLPEVSMYASAVSALPEVRDFLLMLQRGFAEKYSVIMDGRDIGTVVLPNADLKIYLTADAHERAVRRYAELCEKGIASNIEEVEADMIKRDYDDMHRDVAPLKKADDAVTVDTTGLTIEESFTLLRNTVRERLGI